MFLGPIGKTKWLPWSLIGWDIFDISETPERNSRNLTGSKISMSSTEFVFFGTIGKTRWPPWPLIGWGNFDFSSETAEWNSTKLVRKQDHNATKFVFFGPIEKKNMAALAFEWPRHFQLLLWNCWSQCPLPSLCFSGRLEKQDGRPCLWLAETFSTFPLKLQNGIQGNLTWSKISTSSTNFVFFRLIGKTTWLPWPLIGWDIFDFSSETAERNSTKLVLTGRKIPTSFTKFVFFRPIGKTTWPPWPLNGRDIFDFSSETAERNSTKLDWEQDLHVLYQFCVFRANQKTKMAALADSSKRWHIVLWCMICGPLGLLLSGLARFPDYWSPD